MKFILKPANDFIWNQVDFIQFLISNQGQSIVIDTHDEGVDLQIAGVYQLLEQFEYNDVTVITTNLLETHSNFKIKHNNSFKFFCINNTDYSQYHTWTRQKIFAVFYNRPLWHRIGLAAEMQCNFSNLSLINVRCNPNDIDQRSLFEIQKLFKNASFSIDKFVKVQSSWPRQLEQRDGYTEGNTVNAHTDQLACFYPDFLIDIVAETWTQGNTFFPTEKTVRPMLLKKPFVIFGSKNYLEYLRQMGFRTFADFWDEDYDGYEGADRYVRILDLIDKLACKSFDQLETMYWDMQYTLDHNYNLLMSQKFHRSIEYLG
jgi:hypothetical protein